MESSLATLTPKAKTPVVLIEEKNKHEDPIVAKLKTAVRNKHGNSLWSSLADLKFDMKLCTPSIIVNPIGMAISKPGIFQVEIGTDIQYKAMEQ